MTNKLKKRLALIISFALALAFIPAQPAQAGWPNVCVHDETSTEYININDAIADADPDDTIRLIDDIYKYSENIVLGKNINIDLAEYEFILAPVSPNPALKATDKAVVMISGGDIEVAAPTGSPAPDAPTDISGVMADDGASITLEGSITLLGTVGSGSTAVKADGENTTVTVGGSVTANNEDGKGVWALDGATVYVDADVTGAKFGVDATGEGATVTVGGTVKSNNVSVQAINGAAIDVGADVIGAKLGVNAQHEVTTVTVSGNVDGIEIGVSAGYGANVDVSGNVTGSDYGVYAMNEDTTVNVSGNVTGTLDIGILAEGGATVTVGDFNEGTSIVYGEKEGVWAWTGAFVTINGEIETGTDCYIHFSPDGTNIYVKQNGDGYSDDAFSEAAFVGNFILESTANPGYFTYYCEDGDITVLVKNPDYVPPPPGNGGNYSGGNSGGNTTPPPTPPPTSAGGGQAAPNPATKTTKIGKLIVTTPWDYDPVFDEDGNVTLPEGITVELPGKVFLEVPPGTKIANDEHQSLSFPKGGGGTITPYNSGFTFKLHEDAVILFDEDAPLGYRVSIDNPFTDMDDDAWYSEYLLFAYAHGLITGTGTNPMQMSPNMPTTQNMVLTILYRMAGSPDETGEGEWYADAAKWAAENGIADAGGPDAPIERQDLAVILMRFAELMGLEFNEPNEYPGFGDSDEFKGDEEQKAIELLYKAGVINGKPGGVFDPQGEATRAELAAMLMRFLEAVMKK